MKVVQVYKDYYPPTIGGIEQIVERMARWLVRRGDEVTVLTSAGGRPRTVDEEVDGVRVVRTAEFGRALSTPFCPSMPRHMRRIPADVHHLHYPNPTGELSWLAARPRAPMVITYHGDIIRQAALMPVWGPVVHSLLSGATLIMPSTQQMIDRSQFLQRHRAKCRIVALGIDLEPFLAVEQHRARAAEVRARHRTPIVLFVGRLVHFKGLHVLLEAMRSIEATLLIVGDGPARAELERQRDALELGERVVFTGLISPHEIVAWMAAADVGVLPSILPNESFGMSMVELMACGVPVVCTELGTGTSFVNQHGETGFVVPPGDAAALAVAIGRLLADPALRRRMGDAARARATRMFSTDAMMRAVTDVYDEALALHSGGVSARAARSLGVRA